MTNPVALFQGGPVDQALVPDEAFLTRAETILVPPRHEVGSTPATTAARYRRQHGGRYVYEGDVEFDPTTFTPESPWLIQP